MSQGRRAREVENQKGRRAAKPPAENKVPTLLSVALVKGTGRPKWHSGGKNEKTENFPKKVETAKIFSTKLEKAEKVSTKLEKVKTYSAKGEKWEKC